MLLLYQICTDHWTEGYAIDISGTHRKIYHLWKFLSANDAIFDEKQKNFTDVMASFDSEAGSVGSDSYNPSQSLDLNS